LGNSIYGQATYDLAKIKKLLSDPNKRIVTQRCYKNAVSLGYSSVEDIVEQIFRLKPKNLYKTMESNKKLGLWQDVYRTIDNSVHLYIKIQISFNGKGVVIQLKRDNGYR